MPELPNSKSCFVCGDHNPAGLGVRFETDGEQVWTSFVPHEKHMGYAGVTHGGVIAAVLDETMGWAPCVVEKRFCVSVEISVSYRKSLPIGLPVTVRGWMTSSTRRIWEAEGDIRDAEGTVFATGRGRFIPMTAEKSAEVMAYLQFGPSTVPRGDLVK